jgi:hypothetical protein
MTRLGHIATAGLAAIAIGVASSAFAEEAGTFENRLNGASIGLAAGALPEAGLYTGLQTAYLSMLSGNSTIGHSTGNYSGAVLPAIAQAVPLLWVPGWNFLGATYGASVVQAFYTFGACSPEGCGGAAPIVAGGFVYTNTFFSPITLSWNLGNNVFISGAFNFMAPDGTRQVGTPNPDYWTFDPSVAFSYVTKSWLLSANFFYDINTRSAGVCCAANATITSGNSLYGDFTALYKFGKWSIGPVGYFEYQTTADTGTCVVAGINQCGWYQSAAAGGLIGYDFGPLDLQVWVTDAFIGNNTPQGPGGITVWSRIGFKVWGPESQKPLTAKN